MISKVYYFPDVIKLDKYFRGTLNDWERHYAEKLYTAPLIAYYDESQGKVLYKPLVPWQAQELIRKGTFGIYKGRLKGYTKIYKIKNCLYIPRLRNKEEYFAMARITASSLDDFFRQMRSKPLEGNI